MRHTVRAAAPLAALLLLALPARGGDEHWSRQFPRPAQATRMGPGTGMSDGNTKPSIEKVAWRDGKLWMAGAWEAGVSAEDPSRAQRNEYWHLWTWSPEAGYEAVCHFHATQGGAGPDGKIHDFLWLPDGRLVVAGAFTRLDNPGGTRFHRVNALAIYDPREPSADRWRPLGTFQYNGTVSEGGSIMALAYDPQGDDLYLGGTFAGIPGVRSPFIHRYDLQTGSYEPLPPGVGGQKPVIHKLWVDTSTRPSTLYVGGKFHWTAGDGQDPAVSGSTARYSTGFASYQEGSGWTTYPRQGGRDDESVLQRAADYMHFDAVHVLDFLVETTAGGREIWIVGAFSAGKGSGQTLRGVARWDEAGQRWVDPTGKGGFGRECFSIARGGNGKLYFAGAFGGQRSASESFPGLMDGTPAALAASFDPRTGAWEQLGPGLSSLVFPEVRLCAAGDDVWFVGDFHHVGSEGSGGFESWLIARWNETIDFTRAPAEVAERPRPTPPPPLETRPLAEGNEHWSRAFPAPPRRRRPDEPAHTARTGMDTSTGVPEVAAMAWLGDTLYFGGSWQAVPNERWYVWSLHPERGWEKLGWEKGSTRVGPHSPPEGLKAHEGKLWVHGSLVGWNGLAIYDPATEQWAPLEGTYRGEKVTGHAVQQGGGTIHDIAWDSRTGDLYLVGATGLYREGDAKPPAAVIRVDRQGRYHPMGSMFLPEDPGKPVKELTCILLDETQEPTDVYVGGTFGYCGGSSGSRANLCFNVARWDHAKQDWVAFGKGPPAREVDRDEFPDGYPGLPALPGEFSGFLRSDFPRVRCLVMDAARNIYAGGTLAVLDRSLPVSARRESFGIARYERRLDRWVPATRVGGLSRDVLEMRWLDAGRTRLLLSGAFEYANDWTPLGGVAILDTKTGQLERLGGGLLRASREQVVAPMVHHDRRGDELWFSGLFDHAGVNANSRLEAPVESAAVAMWDPTRNLDPNRGLVVKPVAPLPANTGSSAQTHRIQLEAELTDGTGTITWYERGSTGNWMSRGTGPKLAATLRVPPGSGDLFYYVSVTRPDGVEGGKRPVRIPVDG